MPHRGEVPCMISLDCNRNPFVSEVLPIEGNELTPDELRILYLEKSTEALKQEDSLLLNRLLQEIKMPETHRRQVMSVEEGLDNLDKPTQKVNCFAKKYKPVALKVKPVLETLPERFRITREIIGDPLKNMPRLPERPPEFQTKGRYNLDHKEKLDAVHPAGFLWPEERKLMHWLVAEQNKAFVWDDTERGKFKEKFFLSVEIPIVAHIPWVEKPFRIPPAIYEEVCKMIKRKIDAGVYEPSNSSYRSRWFCVIKKNGKSLRIVHSLEPLNRVTIAHSGLPPATEELAMHFAGRACSGILDLYVRYDERVLAERSRDLTMFQTPFGALRLVTLPMGWTNSVPIFHDDVTYILHQEIPRYTLPYIDDVPIRGPETRYELPDGSVETLKQNPGIRKFVFEYLEMVNRILQRMKYAGGTFSGPKTTICSNKITIVGFECSYKGRRPTSNAIGKILHWGACEDTTDIRAFLGTAVQCRNHIPNFVTVATPLYEIVKKNMTFE